MSRAGQTLLALVAGGLAALAGCGSGGRSSSTTSVVATTTQLADFVRVVGGPHVRVHGLLRPNVDPHEYEPTPHDVAAVAGAQVVVENGVGLDQWVDKLASDAGGKARVVNTSAGVPLRDHDPHIWLDPRNAERMVANVAFALAAADPRHSTAYRRRAGAYVSRLKALDRRLARALAAVPPARRLVVTDHDALGYLAARYRIRVVGAVIPSLSTGAEPSARSLARLVDTIRRERVRAVFSERSVDPRVERQVAAESGVPVLADLYGDSLGPAGSPGATYVGMMEADVASMVRGMGR